MFKSWHVRVSLKYFCHKISNSRSCVVVKLCPGSKKEVQYSTNWFTANQGETKKTDLFLFCSEVSLFVYHAFFLAF